MLATLYIGYTMIRSFRNPLLGPPLPMEDRATSYGQIAAEFFKGIVPLAAIIFAALGSIIAGMATPTEAAAMGALGASLLTFFYGRLNYSTMREATLKTLQTSSLVLFLAVASNIYGAVFTRLGTSSMLASTLVALPVPPLVMLALLMAVIFLLGWPLEWPAIIFIFLPIFIPVVQELKFDLLWFSTLVAVNLQTAFLSPPVAMAAYYLKAVAPQWELSDIYRGMVDFMILQMIGLALVFFFPQIALWLPNLIYGR
jgi:tripartite ATP-independent transporter DctM subunit